MRKVWATSMLAQDVGTAEEAQAMLEAAALAAFTAGEPPFRGRDLYVFCGGDDGVLTAHGANPALIGEDMRALAVLAALHGTATLANMPRRDSRRPTVATGAIDDAPRYTTLRRGGAVGHERAPDRGLAARFAQNCTLSR